MTKSTEEAGRTIVGKTITVKGEITGTENLVIDGVVEGEIRIDQDLQINPGGVVKAKVAARNVTISGSVTGAITAIDKAEILAGGIVTGDVKSPRFVVRDGGTLNGKIEMPI